MDLKYTRKKLSEAAMRAEHARTLPHDDKVFHAFTAAMGALYACFEWLPDDLQADARQAYDALNATLEEDVNG
jgi:hypothetical protein